MSAHVVFGRIATPLRDNQTLDLTNGAMAVTETGEIAWIGAAAELPELYAAWQKQGKSSDLVLPGFVDAHSHYPQSYLIGAWGADLLDWLNTYTFPEESRFGDRSYADQVADLYCRQLKKNGISTACVFSTIHFEAFQALTQAAQRHNLRVISGITAMDRNCPDSLQVDVGAFVDVNQQAYEFSQGFERLGYAVTPRFAITSTDAQLSACGDFLEKHSDVLMQTHINENKDEIALTAELFPKASSYLDVYDQFGLVTDRSLFAHGIYGTDAELARMADTGASVVHCPTSNTFLGSGLIDANRYDQRQIKLGLGCDTGGGTSFSPWATMAEAYKVAKLQGRVLKPQDLFLKHTLTNAKILKMDAKVGSLEPGKQADYISLDLSEHPLVTPSLARDPSLANTLFALMFLAAELEPERSQLYIAGRRV